MKTVSGLTLGVSGRARALKGILRTALRALRCTPELDDVGLWAPASAAFGFYFTSRDNRTRTLLPVARIVRFSLKDRT